MKNYKKIIQKKEYKSLFLIKIFIKQMKQFEIL